MLTASSREYRLPGTYADHRAQQRKFQSAEGAIAYTDHGSGPVLVLLHGVPTSSWMYRKMIPDLQASFRVITIDLLGYGSSDKPRSEGSSYSIATQAGCVREVLTHLDVDRYQLLFHDMGGLVAWRLVSEDIVSGTGNVTGLVVLNTIISRQGFNHPNFERGKLSRSLSRAYRRKLSGRAILGFTFKQMGLTEKIELNENECLGYAQPLREGADIALYEFFTGMDEARFGRLEQDMRSLRQFRGKTLVVWGAKDKVLTTAQLPQLFQHLRVPKSDVHILDEHSHFLAEEIPSRLSDLVGEALR